ncbi:MAG TPA: ABC transporter substrate-binding protein [Stellaceae bacterium]|nr:ABC transporter substrate-binding protein [Stellaceae bacterium]
MRRAVAALAFVAMLGAAEAQATHITIGAVPSTSAAATFLALDKGYFRELGLDVEIEPVDSASKVIPLLATGHLQVVEGGISVGYFNALLQDLPIVLALERGSSPTSDAILVRNDVAGAIRIVADLAGRPVALVAPGTMPVYETGKVLARAGLTLKDIDVRYMPFPAMGAALANKAVDAVYEIPPFGDMILEQSLAKPWLVPDEMVQPAPVSTTGYLANTDWVAQNRGLARRIFVALLRAAREYCQAYHHGPNRAEVIDAMARHGLVKDRALLERTPWQARNVDGRFNLASLMDFQAFFVHEHVLDRMAPAERLVDASFADDAVKELGRFALANTASTLAGCR